MNKRSSMFAAALFVAACSSSPTVAPAPERVSGLQYSVYFSSGSSAITDDADETLRELAGLIREFAPTRVLVAGHADTAEPDPDGVSKARADLVARRLAALSVTSEIRTRSAGATELAVQTPAGTKEAQNRRVTIDY